MSINGSNLSANATCFIPRVTLTHSFPNTDSDISIGSYNSWMVNTNNFGNSPLNNGNVYNYSYLPINSQYIQQVIYTCPQYSYAFSNQNASQPLNICYNNSSIYDQNILSPKNKKMNYSNESLKLIDTNINIINKDEKINSKEYEIKEQIINKNEFLNNNNTIDEPSLLNLEMNNYNNKLLSKVTTTEVKRIKKKKGKSYICIDEYEQIKGVNQDNFIKVDNFMKPTFKSYSSVAKNQNNAIIKYCEESDIQDSKNMIKHSSKNTSNSDNKNGFISNIGDSTEILNNENTSNKSLKDINLPKSNDVNGNNNIELNNNLKKQKISYSSIVKIKDSDISNSHRIKINENKKNELKEKSLDENIPNNLEKNCVQIQSNQITHMNRMGDLCKFKDMKNNSYKNESNTSKTSENKTINNLSVKNWTLEGKLLFNEWEKSRSKFSEEDKNETQQPFILKQTAHLLNSKQKNNKTFNVSPLTLDNKKLVKEKIILPNESNDDSKDNIVTKLESELEWLAVKNKNRNKMSLSNNDKIIHSDNLKTSNHHKLNANIFKTQISVSQNIDDFVFKENKQVDIISNNLNNERNSQIAPNRIKNKKFKYKKWENITGDLNFTDKVTNKTISNINIKINENPSKNEPVCTQNSKKLITNASHLLNTDLNKKIYSGIKDASPILNQIMKNIEDRKTITMNQTKEYDMIDHRTIITKKMNINKKPLSRNQSQPSLVSRNQSQQQTRKSETPILLDFSKLIQTKKDNKNDAKLKSKASKKDKLQIQKGANLLDTTVVAKRRGKEKANPKKKLSTLKKILLNEKLCKRNEFLKKYGLLRTQSLDSLSNLAHLHLDANFDTCDHNDIYIEKENEKIHQDANFDTCDYNDISCNEENTIINTSNEFSTVSSSTTANACLEESANLQLNNLDPILLAKQNIHSNKFRDYCNHVLSQELDLTCKSFIRELFRFQDRLYHNDPMKYKIRRRYVCGLREVLKFLKLNKLKCVIIAPDIQKSYSEGGLNSIIETILSICNQQSLNYFFVMNRKSLSEILFKKTPISIIGIINYEGAEELYNQMVSLVLPLRIQYNNLLSTELFQITIEMP